MQTRAQSQTIGTSPDFCDLAPQLNLRQLLCKTVVFVSNWRESLDFHARTQGLIVKEQVPGCVALVIHPGASWMLLGTRAIPGRFEKVESCSYGAFSVRIEVENIAIWSAPWTRSLRSQGISVADVQRQPWGVDELSYVDNEERRWTMWQKKFSKA